MRGGKTLRKGAIAAAFVVAGVFAGAASADEGDVEVGGHFGPYVPFLASSQNKDMKIRSQIGYGGFASYGISDQAAVELIYIRSHAGADLGDGHGAKVLFDEALAGFSWSVLTRSVRPRFVGGVGYQLIHSDGPIEDENSYGMHMGFGITGVVLPQLHVSATARYHYYFVQEFSADQVLSVLASVSILF